MGHRAPTLAAFRHCNRTVTSPLRAWGPLRWSRWSRTRVTRDIRLALTGSSTPAPSRLSRYAPDADKDASNLDGCVSRDERLEDEHTSGTMVISLSYTLSSRHRTHATRMIDFTDEQIATKELRNAAYHEAGHKMLYEHFGGAGDAVVWKNQSGNPEETAWLGQFRPRTCPEAMRKIARTQGLITPELPANWRVLVGMAGLLAEDILSDETDDVGAMADTLFFRIWNGEASASDLALMNITDIDSCAPSYEVVEECVRLLREGWSDVQREAEYLIAASSVNATCS